MHLTYGLIIPTKSFGARQTSLLGYYSSGILQLRFFFFYHTYAWFWFPKLSHPSSSFRIWNLTMSLNSSLFCCTEKWLTWFLRFLTSTVSLLEDKSRAHMFASSLVSLLKTKHSPRQKSDQRPKIFNEPHANSDKTFFGTILYAQDKQPEPPSSE